MNNAYEYEVQGLYGGEWEAVTAEDSLDEARQRLDEYRDNEPCVPFRIRRFPIE